MNIKRFSTKPDREQSQIKEKGISICSTEHLNIEVNTNKILSKFLEIIYLRTTGPKLRKYTKNILEESEVKDRAGV